MKKLIGDRLPHAAVLAIRPEFAAEGAFVVRLEFFSTREVPAYIPR
jgi:hypothetical protein